MWAPANATTSLPLTRPGQIFCFGELVLLKGQWPPLSNLLSLLEQASVRKDEVAATTCLTGAGAFPRGQHFYLCVSTMD